MPILGEIAAAAAARLQGCNPATVITGVAPLSSAEPGQLSFLTHSRYRPFLATTRAAAVILAPADAVAGLLRTIDGLTADDSGGYRDWQGGTLPW